MSTIIPEAELPVELTAMQAVEAAYPAELQRSLDALQRGLPVLVECDKELGPYFYARLRDRLRTAGHTCLYLDGRQVEGIPQPPDGMGLISAIIFQLREAVRGAITKRVIVLPHLDLLTASTGGLTAEAREVIPLLYENPEILFIGFKDPTFPVPQVIENLFPHRESILGISRERLRYLVTQREARKFGQGLPVYVLYKQVSGANAVRLRRMLSSMSGVDYPPDPRPALAQLRAATLVGEASVPDMDLRKDIGGYGKVKDQLQFEIIDVLKAKDALSDPAEIKRIEQLIPRGMLLWGPPGTGKGNPLSERVLTPTGWRKMGDIKPGDYVTGSDGEKTKVTAVFPLGMRDIFRVTLSDHGVVRVTGDHLWAVDRRSHGKWRRVIVETSALRRHDRVPTFSSGAAYGSREVPIDPWLLGALLGNGGLTSAGLQFSSGRRGIVKEVIKRLPQGVVMTKGSGPVQWRISDDNSAGSWSRALGGSVMWTRLKSIGLLRGHRSYDKFIPALYMENSVAFRVGVLQGLLDTDGRGTRGGVEYSTTSPQLRDGVIDLVRSLGGVAWLSSVDTREKNKKNKNHCFTVRMHLPPGIRPFPFSGKKESKPKRGNPRRRFVDSIKPDGREKAQCIKVAADDHLYASGDYVLTHNTLVAKAMASALGAAVTVVSGPELKSKWVGESEERLRAVFVRARQSAPAVIIFDEIDSFASARGLHTGGSGVEHSMVNQLLTEMDGFRKEELVFVVGTTNFVESLDPALLRPGRFEFHLHIPYPNTEDRRAILDIYDKKFGLKLSPPALEYLVKRTGDLVEGAVGGTRHSGDHIQAICRQLARRRLRETTTAQVTEIADVETTLARYQDRPELTAHEEHVVATHEAGHAVCALFCEHSPPIDRISIRGDLAGALGFVQYADPAHRYVMTRGQLLDMIVVLFGGREAESLLLDDLSIGSSQDLERATAIARALVEEFGLVDSPAGVRRFTASHEGEAAPLLSNETRADLEKGVREVLAKARARAQTILQEQRTVLTALRDLLLEKKSLDRAAFAHLLPGRP